MPKELKFNEMALKSIHNGIKILAKTVKATLGPKGRNVIIKNGYSSLISTKDGVSVAKEVILKDKFENVGAQIVKEASLKTAEMAGDGTTTAIVLAEAIFSEGMKNITASSSPVQIKKGIDKAVNAVCNKLSDLAIQLKGSDEIRQIATVSANNDEEIGSIIAQAMQKTGKDGIITAVEATGVETTLDIVEGMQFNNGYLSPYFINNPEKMIVEYENALIFITDKKLSSAKEIVSILEIVFKEQSIPLLIIAEDIDSDALSTLVVNKVKGNLPVCAVKSPFYGDRKKEVLLDIASLTGATVVCDELNNSSVLDIRYFGKAKKIKVAKDASTIIEGSGEASKIKEREKQIRFEISKSKSDYDIEKLQERLAHLAGGIAVIKVGASTESEMKEKKQRVEDALHAAKAAAIEGIVPGGGVALLRCISCLDDLKYDNEEEKIGIQIIKNACYAPAITIANNAGKNGLYIAEKILETKGSWGYNALSDKFSDLIKDGVIDPVLVTKTALKNAASIASLLISVDAIITDKPTAKKEKGFDQSAMGYPPMDDMSMM
ncbi:MAG: chaperonin GroEL [Parachlamydiales bacterium]|jgi:chaperonin GroEL